MKTFTAFFFLTWQFTVLFCACILVCQCGCMHPGRGQKSRLGIFLNDPTLYFLRQSLSLNLEVANSASWLAHNPQDPLVPTFPARSLQARIIWLLRISSPHAYEASTLLFSPAPFFLTCMMCKDCYDRKFTNKEQEKCAQGLFCSCPVWKRKQDPFNRTKYVTALS